MTYCTQSDLIERFGEQMIVALTDRSQLAQGVINPSVVERALADTDAMVNGYIGSRYDITQLTPVPPLLRDIAISIAIWKLHVAPADTKIEADYKDARATLREVAQGLASLGDVAAAAQASAPATIRYTDRERPLSADTLKGYI